jgi:hypothetical protein
MPTGILEVPKIGTKRFRKAVQNKKKNLKLI